MHDGEVDINSQLLTQLLSAQFPRLCHLPIEVVHSTGTVNAIYRIGEDLCARLPRVETWAADLEKELALLPKLAPLLSVAIPRPVERGEPWSRYPFVWAIYEWIGGEIYASDRIDDECQAAVDLAQFVAEVRRADPSAGPRGGRAPLDQLDAVTRTAIASIRGDVDVEVDADALSEAWEISLRAPAAGCREVWRHGDLLPPNLLVENGRLRAVIDFGSACVGDPASDVIPAWTVFGEAARIVFRDSLAVDDATWARARGYALHQALLIIPYYAVTNPGLASMATHTIEAVLGELGLST
ncbi:MAG: aminoglycoside phosphotransferase family protein [Acidimicrobiales bacterium]